MHTDLDTLEDWMGAAMNNAPAPIEPQTTTPEQQEPTIEAVTLDATAARRKTLAAADLERRIWRAQDLVQDQGTWAWAIVSAAAAAGTAHLLGLPVAAAILLGLLGAGLGFIGLIDARTKLILNDHTLAFAILVIAGLSSLQITGWPDPVLPLAVGTAVGVFLVMLVLWWFTGFASGGDIKLAPIVAAGLSFISPMTASLWLLVAFGLCLVVAVVRAIVTRSRTVRSVPMGPLMAVALPVSLALTTWLYAALELALPGV